MASSSRLRRLDDAVVGEGALYDRRAGAVDGVRTPIAVIFPLVVLAGLSVLFGVRFHSVWYGFAFAAGSALLLAAARAVRGRWYWQRATRKESAT